MTILIDLLRHGEPVGGTKYRGQLDEPLSDKGWQQMRAATANMQPWQHIITSPLKRCADFAVELAEQQQLPLMLESRFKEIGFGDWEGKTAAELEQSQRTAFHAFYEDPLTNTPPGAEPLPIFQQRVEAGWQSLLAQFQEQHILVVGHAGMMRVILAHVLDMPLAAMFRLHVPHAGISRIEVAGSPTHPYPRLLFHAGSL